MIPAPRSSTVPCSEECDHLDCRGARSVADTPCVTCGRPIGYETAFRVLREWDVVAHHECPDGAVPDPVAAWWNGLRAGVHRYAWWKDGEQYVGSGVYTLGQALARIDADQVAQLDQRSGS